MKLFTVGPVEMYENTLKISAEPIPYFRNQEFSDVMLELDNNMKHILQMKSEDKNIFLTASGTGAMEAVVLNCLNENDKVLIVSGGTFGKRFEQICSIHRICYDVLSVPFGKAFEADMLSQYEKVKYSAMIVNIHETSVGQLYPIKLLSDFCKRKKMYFIVDAISSLFADDIKFTDCSIDALIVGSQKALALAPGIAVVSLSEKMCQKLNPNPATMYFDFNMYIADGKRGQTPFTPAIGILLQMSEMIKEIKEVGIENKILKTKMLADDFREKLKSAGFGIPEYPLSNAMTPILFTNGAKYYYEKLISDYGIVVNPCGADLTDRMLRVGHMGNLTVDDNDNLIKALTEIRSCMNEK